MVERVRRFNGDKLPFYMEVYNAEMDIRSVNDAFRLKFFCQVTAPRIHTEVKQLEETHSSWETFGEALWRAYDEPLRCRNRRDFDHWVVSAKTHRGATKAFLEFGRRFAQLTEQEQRLVGAEKVLLFVSSIDRAEREVIGIELEEDDRANGLTEDWSKVERVYQRLDEEQSTKARGKTRHHRRKRVRGERVGKARHQSPSRGSVHSFESNGRGRRKIQITD